MWSLARQQSQQCYKKIILETVIKQSEISDNIFAKIFVFKYGSPKE